jgi:hypothetical protein
VKNNSLGGADVNEASLQLAPDSVGSTQIATDSLTTADIDESTLNVLQGHGSSSVSAIAQVQNTLVFADVAQIAGAGFIQATCNAAGTAATFRYRDTSGSLSYVWVDTGVDQPANLATNSNSTSATTVTSTAFDVMTWFVRPGASPFSWTTVQLAMSNEGGFCTYFKLAQQVKQ